MIKLLEYKGHIRNFDSLIKELNIDESVLSNREKREELILTEGFKNWGEEIGYHIFGMFAFCLYDDE